MSYNINLSGEQDKEHGREGLDGELHYIHYKNKKGKCVKAEITKHARIRYLLRCRIYYGFKCPPTEVYNNIQSEFSRAQRLNHVNARRAQRNKRRGREDTLYYINKAFTFVIKDGCLITIELKKPLNHLNKYNSFIDYSMSKDYREDGYCNLDIGSEKC